MYLFAFVEGGVRHVAIYEDKLAFLMHGENAFKAPFFDRGVLLAQYTTSEGVVMGLPENL